MENQKNEEQILNHKLEEPITFDVIETILSDQKVRTVIAKESHYWFFHLYFSQYVKYKTAEFQKELFSITENEDLKLSVVVAFRGSGKSTIMTMSYPLWAVLGKQQKKCIVILSQTQQQARIHLANIKRELENNELLKSDLGPFQEEAEEWGSYSLVIPRFDSKIVAASSEQSIRGIRHGANRPDLIICDDVEDLNSVKTRDSRNKTNDWFSGEIMPLGDKSTKIILVGNLLHEDSLLMRIKEGIQKQEINAVYKEYPIMDENKVIAWPGKYGAIEEIESERKLHNDDSNWQREYMLKIVSGIDQVVQKEWIKYYDELPVVTRFNDNGYDVTISAVDLAISENERADCTAIVTAHLFGEYENLKVYIEPNPFNKRVDFPKIVTKLKEVISAEPFGYERNHLYVEDVAFQKSAIQTLRKQGFWRVEGFKVGGKDKRFRLNSITPLLESGHIYFPRTGADDLIQQLTYFGVEKHDDLVDAFVMVMMKVIEKEQHRVHIMNAADLGL